MKYEKYRILNSEVCPLCRSGTDLQKSHIVSKVLLARKPGLPADHIAQNRILLVDPVTGHEEQDGEKYRLLCKRCEQRLGNGCEDSFASAIFNLKPVALPVAYGTWMHEFVLAQSFRTLHCRWHKAYQHPPFPNGKPYRRRWVEFSNISAGFDVEPDIIRAENVWRECLFGIRRSPGQFKQYLIPFATARHQANRWINRVVLADLKIERDVGIAATFVLAGGLCFIGTIQDNDEIIKNSLLPYLVPHYSGHFREMSDSFTGFVAKLGHPIQDWFTQIYRTYHATVPQHL